MRLPIRLAILPALLAANAADLHAQPGQQSGPALVEFLLEQSASLLQKERFVGRPPVVSTLDRGTTSAASFTVAAGHDYVVVAACDEKCDVPALTVSSSAGTGEGGTSGDFSVISFRAATGGVHTVTLRLANCDAARCAVGHQVFERSSTLDRRVCVIEDGALTNVVAQYDPMKNDTTVAGRPFADVYPSSAPTYAAAQRWMRENEEITFGGRSYVKYGLPRVLGVDEVVRVGEYRGTSVFAEESSSEVVYVPVRTGCEFQPYQRAVR